MADKILLVEDDAVNVKFIQVVLTRRGGYEVIVSEEVAEILRFVKEEKPVLVIMDVSLTRSIWDGRKVDGLYITKLLKQDPDCAGVPVMLATAHAMFGDRERFLRDTGAEGYLAKPLHDPDAFLKAVRDVIAKAG
ncbi:MAG: response regulator [Acidobacteria bacterium]|nr:response regulator [Acidobacteriota bacterium]